MRYLIIIILLIGLIILGDRMGCSQNGEEADQEPQEESREEPQEQKSVIEKTAEDITGKTTIQKGEEAKEKIKEIESDRQQQLEDVLKQSD